MQQIFDSFLRSTIIAEKENVNQDTVILGLNSKLDSIGFVTFITELEERVSIENKNDIYLIMDDIHEFNKDNKILSAKILADYIQKITK
jgi:acyl carrier protein